MESTGQPQLHLEAILAELRRAVARGDPWFLALLEAIARWDLPEEEVEGRRYRYLVGGEAFDWLLLAERLCRGLDGLVPPAEQEALLFQGELPLELSPADLCHLLGSAKYKAHLNYFYGVTVEEALQLATAEELHKELYSNGLTNGAWDEEMAFQRLYGRSRRELLALFRAERGLPPGRSLAFADWKEFTYWLFKSRVRGSEPARLASDTRKALGFLARQREEARRRREAPPPGVVDLPGQGL